MKKINEIRLKLRYMYIVLFFLGCFMLDWGLRKTYIDLGDVELYDKILLFFVLGWCLVLAGISLALPYLGKKIFMTITIIIFSVLTLVHGAYINVFDKFFSFADLSLLKEGMDFADSSYIDIEKKIIIIVTIAIILALLASCSVLPNKNKHEKWWGIGVIVIGSVFIWSAKISFPEAKDATTWDSASSITIVYNDFVDTKRCMILCGLYEYTIKDIWEQLDWFSSIKYEEQVKELDEYFAEKKEKMSNPKTGIFKGKNLMMIQLENIDTWMLTEENMPNMYKLKQEGIDFLKHYLMSFATGKTFNTEFIVNTGYVPQAKGEAPSYIYSKNYYPNSLANLFKKEGYAVNSFHSSNGSIYNRAKVHEVFGYEKYHSWIEMKMEDYTMDSQMLNNFEEMIKGNKFFDFIITYSGHGPFSMENAACKAHIQDVRAENDDKDETYLYGLAQAKETDEFVRILIEKLEEYELLEDTVLVFYTDHYAYSTIDEEKELELKGTDDPNLIQNTPFFIWSNDLQSEKVDKVTSTVDILPTIINMFGIDADFRYWIGRDVFDDEVCYAFFSDFSWFDGEIYFNNQYDGKITKYIVDVSKDVEKKIKMSWNVLETNYFEVKK